MSEEQILALIVEKENELKDLYSMLPRSGIGFITIAGVKIKNPNFKTAKQTISTSVDAGINGNNQFVGTKLGRDRSKIEYLRGSIDDSELKMILNIFENNFINPVSYYDMQKGFITRLMYPSDRNGTPLHITSAMSVKKWADIGFNLVDTGRGA